MFDLSLDCSNLNLVICKVNQIEDPTQNVREHLGIDKQYLYIQQVVIKLFDLSLDCSNLNLVICKVNQIEDPTQNVREHLGIDKHIYKSIADTPCSMWIFANNCGD